MRVWNSESQLLFYHKERFATSIRAVKSKIPERSDQQTFLFLDTARAQRRYGQPALKPHYNPSLKNFFQILSAFFAGLSRGPNSLKIRYFPIKRFFVLN